VTYWLCGAGALIAVLGDVCFKRWVQTGAPSWIVAGVLLFALDSLVWAGVLLRGAGLAIGSALWASFALLLGVIVAVAIFDESLTLQQTAGVILVVVGIWLCR